VPGHPELAAKAAVIAADWGAFVALDRGYWPKRWLLRPASAGRFPQPAQRVPAPLAMTNADTAAAVAHSKGSTGAGSAGPCWGSGRDQPSREREPINSPGVAGPGLVLPWALLGLCGGLPRACRAARLRPRARGEVDQQCLGRRRGLQRGSPGEGIGISLPWWPLPETARLGCRRWW